MTENKEKAAILSDLSIFDTRTLRIAYLYAKNYVEYGVNVTEKWVTACQNSESLERAYHKGYCECYERMRQDYHDKLKVKDEFGDGKVILDPEKPNFGLDSDLKACTDEKKEPKFKVGDKIWSGCDKIECIVTKVLEDNYYKVTSNGSEFTVYENEMELVKEEKPKFKYEIGQIVRKKGGYPNTLTFKVVDRYMVNKCYPYYKIQNIHSTIPDNYEYVPESALKNTNKACTSSVVKARWRKRYF